VGLLGAAEDAVPLSAPYFPILILPEGMPVLIVVVSPKLVQDF